MSEDLSLHKRRWYDSIANLTMALHISRQLPEAVQGVIAKRLNAAIDETRRQQRGTDGFTSLGQYRVLGIYRAGNRQRWYDLDPALHRAYTMMSTVPEPFLIDFANRLLQAGRYLDEQPPVFRNANPDLINDTLDSILQRQAVTFETSEDGIRLVSLDELMDEMTRDTGTPMHPRNIVPMHRPRRKG